MKINGLRIYNLNYRSLHEIRNLIVLTNEGDKKFEKYILVYTNNVLKKNIYISQDKKINLYSTICYKYFYHIDISIDEKLPSKTFFPT